MEEPSTALNSSRREGPVNSDSDACRRIFLLTPAKRRQRLGNGVTKIFCAAQLSVFNQKLMRIPRENAGQGGTQAGVRLSLKFRSLSFVVGQATESFFN
jgi:hypothetical protein